MSATTVNRSAAQKLADLLQALSEWEANLNTYVTQAAPDAVLHRIGIQMSVIDDVRDIITPGWSD